MSDFVKILPYSVDLNETIEKTDLHTLFVMGDNLAHRFELEICRGSDAFSLKDSTVTGWFTNFKEKTTFKIEGSVQDGKAIVTLSRPCYTLHGQFVLTIQISKDGADTTIFFGEGYMRTSKAEKIIYDDYVIYDIDTLLAQISAIKKATEDAQAATTAATTAAGTATTAAGNANENAQAAQQAAQAANTAAKNWGDSTAANAEKLGGKQASEYMLKTETAANAEKLGGKPPEHFVRPFDAIKNGDFANVINPGAKNTYTTAGECIADWTFRRAKGSLIVDKTNRKIRITSGDGDSDINGIYQTVSAQENKETFRKMAGKPYTFAVKFAENTIDGVVSIDIYESDYVSAEGTNAIIYGRKTIPAQGKGIFVINCTIPETLTLKNLIVTIRIRKSNAPGYIDLDWAHLYEGTFSADTIPEHEPTYLIKSEQMIDHVGRNFRHYVDGINGSDDNDGLTQTTALKTITKWLSLCNNGRIENRCNIVSAGVYNIPYSCFAGLALHITGLVDGVILNFQKTGTLTDCVFYGTHYNLSNLTLRFDHDECRFETCSLIFEKCIFEAPLVTFYDSFLDAQTECTFPRTVLYGTSANLRYFKSTCTSGNALSLVKGSTVRVYTEITFANQKEGNSDSAFSLQNSILWLEAGTINGSGFATGIYTESSIVGLPPSRYTLLKKLATTPTSELATKPSLFIAGTTVIGGEYT